MSAETLDRRTLIKLAAGLGLSTSLMPLPGFAHKLIRNRIPGTSELLPAIGLGTSAFKLGSAADNAAQTATLDAFTSLGGSLLDTAPVYYDSETVLGNWMTERQNRQQLFVATKVETRTYAAANQRMQRSAEKLQTGTIDLIQSHQMNRAEKTLPAMYEWQQDKRVRYVGITTSNTATFPRMLELMHSHQLDFIQVNYSLSNREAADAILPLARDKGIAVLINIPFARGELFKAVDGKALPDWASEFDCQSWAQFFLKYVISHPAVTAAIPGATKTRHVIDNFGASFGALPNQQMRKRQEAFIDAL